MRRRFLRHWTPRFHDHFANAQCLNQLKPTLTGIPGPRTHSANVPTEHNRNQAGYLSTYGNESCRDTLIHTYSGLRYTAKIHQKVPGGNQANNIRPITDDEMANTQVTHHIQRIV